MQKIICGYFDLRIGYYKPSSRVYQRSFLNFAHRILILGVGAKKVQKGAREDKIYITFSGNLIQSD